MGSIIGYLMGMKAWVNMSIILSATYLGTGIYSIIFKGVSGVIPSFDPTILMGLMLAIIIIIIIIMRLLLWNKQSRNGV
ncbi:MAG: hypothetical protein ACI9CF_000995 [Candidatus Omnitrophota bacterium]|jgi:hypothetical protein